MTEKDVHTKHCCIMHGCKYYHDYCPVEKAKKKQSYPCEWCMEEWDENEEIAYLMNEMFNKGFIAGHVRGSNHAQRLASQLYGPPQ